MWVTRGQESYNVLFELAGDPYQQRLSLQIRLFLLAEKLSGNLGAVPLLERQFNPKGQKCHLLATMNHL